MWNGTELMASLAAEPMSGGSVFTQHHPTSSHWPANFPSAFFFTHVGSKCNPEKRLGIYFSDFLSDPKFYFTLFLVFFSFSLFLL